MKMISIENVSNTRSLDLKYVRIIYKVAFFSKYKSLGNLLIFY